MAAEIFTSDWADLWADAINANTDYKKAATKWEGAIGMIMTADGDMGIPDSFLVHSLLGFNLGVEIGQVAIVMAVFPVLYFLRSTMLYNRLLLPAAAAALIMVSLYWFTERAFEVDLPAGAIMNSIIGREA